MTRTLDGIEGEGSSQHAETAFENSVFEALERTFATEYDPSALVSGSYDSLRPKAVDPRELVLMSAWEHRQAPRGYVRFHSRLPLHWQRCWEITSGGFRRRLVPATLSILRFSWSHPRERFAATLSAGIASGPTYAGALLHACYELVERDAFMLAWLRRNSCPVVPAPDFVDDQLTDSHRRLTQDGFEATFVDLTNDIGIPAFLTVIRLPDARGRRGGFPAFGLGANLDPRKALSRSYAEALELLVNHYDFSSPDTIRIRRVQSLRRGFRPRQYYEECRFLWAGTGTSDILRRNVPRFGGSWSELETCLAHLTSRDVRTYFVDLTPPGLRPARYRLVRVLATRLQPHLYELDSWRLDNPRLYPTVAGARRVDRRHGEAGLNLAPNPYTVLEHVRLY
ncbi:MAG: YcaO-like family protein [Vicinamibacterales bacterium]